MANRYELQIGEQSVQGGFMTNPGASNGEIIGRSIAGAGDALNRYALAAQERQEKWDAAKVMNAQTEFQKRMHDWLYNPETGQIITRKLSNSRGLTDEQDEYADKLINEIAGGLDNQAQKAAFLNTAGKLNLPYWEQASRHEAREGQQYSDNAHKANIQSAYDMAMSDPTSREARARALEQVENATRSYMKGYDNDSINQAILQYQSQIDGGLIIKLARDDPVSALALLNERGNDLKLTPEMRDKLIASIQPKAEIYEVQGIVDDLVNKFGVQNEGAVIDYIRKNFSGEREERLVSAYARRVNEHEIDEHNARQRLALAQNDYYNQALSDIIEHDIHLSDQQLEDALANKRLTPQQVLNLQNANKTAATRAEVTKRLSRQRDWPTDPRKQEERVINYMAARSGLTNAERQQILAELAMGTMTGDIDKSVIDGYYASGVITKSEAVRLKESQKKYLKVQQEFIKSQVDQLKVDMRKILVENKDIYVPKAISKFQELLKEYDITSGTFRKDVVDARYKAMAYVIENNNISYYRSDYQDLQSRMTDDIINTQEYTANFQIDAIDINAGGGGTELWQGVTDARNITSHYGAGREGGKRIHGGLDIGARKGSPVKVPKISGLEVTSVYDGSFANDTAHKGGNSVTLSGTLSNGKDIKIKLMHLQEGSINVKKGDKVNPGDVIAKVGNTGVTSGGADTSKGYHLHIEIYEDGKRVDPEKYLIPKTKADERQTTQQVIKFENRGVNYKGERLDHLGFDPIGFDDVLEFFK